MELLKFTTLLPNGFCPSPFEDPRKSRFVGKSKLFLVLIVGQLYSHLYECIRTHFDLLHTTFTKFIENTELNLNGFGIFCRERSLILNLLLNLQINFF